MLAYRVYETKAEAARSIGKGPKWLEYHGKAHPAFRQAMDSKGRWRREQLERLMMEDMAATAIVAPMEIVESPGKLTSHRFEAVKLALKMSGQL